MPNANVCISFVRDARLGFERAQRNREGRIVGNRGDACELRETALCRGNYPQESISHATPNNSCSRH